MIFGLRYTAELPGLDGRLRSGKVVIDVGGAGVAFDIAPEEFDRRA